MGLKCDGGITACWNYELARGCSALHVATTWGVPYETRDKTVSKRRLSSPPAVHGPTADEGNTSTWENKLPVKCFSISLVCGLRAQVK